ncbi:unnamed protein product [Parnassius apollo]|uniref:(apollo) hypothetical protein n=1 Tax=Parnassius apollo TaxID=110799 RepID=A0A8S3WB57_PARAO|nr:unnamed protein product [Parnassius apollo]
MIARSALRNYLWRTFRRRYSESSSQTQGSSFASPSAVINTNVPGLSSAVIHPSSQPVGPGVDPSKNGAYKVPEYFCYDNMSYFEAEIEMAKFRLPQPSATKK